MYHYKALVLKPIRVMRKIYAKPYEEVYCLKSYKLSNVVKILLPNALELLSLDSDLKEIDGTSFVAMPVKTNKSVRTIKSDSLSLSDI